MSELTDILDEIRSMTEHPELFTKEEFVEKLAHAWDTIETLRQLLVIHQNIGLQSPEPERSP